MNRRQRRALARQNGNLKKAPPEATPKKILIWTEAGGRRQCVDYIDRDSEKLHRYLKAPNLKRIVKQRATGFILELHLVPHGDDTKRPSHEGGQRLSYEETIVEQYHLEVLKIFDEDEQRYRRWSDTDGFNPLRFNPEVMIPKGRAA